MWLLVAAIRQQIEEAQRSGMVPAAEQQVDYEARIMAAASADIPRIMSVAGNNAEIAVTGTLTNRPSFMAFMFGGGNTTYAEIISALAIAEQDDKIEDITLNIDSPGGSVAGLFDALAAIEAAKKPITAVVSNMAASAAFAIAAQADKIIATNRAAMFGSIGIVMNFGIDDGIVTVTSTDAPKKAPDPTTTAGKAAVVEELDALHEIFVDSIAAGRGTTVEKVNAEFGQGATLLAGEALKRGMIDEVAETPLRVVASTDSTTTANSGTKPEASKMDLNTLKAQHADVYAAAVQEGKDQERDRVSAHLTMGEASGDMKTAMGAITEGSEMTASLQAKYMAAGMNRRDVNDRQDDDNNADTGDNGSQDEGAASAKQSADILATAAELCGQELEA